LSRLLYASPPNSPVQSNPKTEAMFVVTILLFLMRDVNCHDHDDDDDAGGNLLVYEMIGQYFFPPDVDPYNITFGQTEFLRDPMFDVTGVVIGYTTDNCVVLDGVNGVSDCIESYYFANGNSITVKGPYADSITDPKAPNIQAVIGGTGKYKNARGEARAWTEFPESFATELEKFEKAKYWTAFHI